MSQQFSTNLDDTQPGRALDELQAPPRLLFYGVIGLFVLGVTAAAVGVYIFREVLDDPQRFRVIEVLPFMEVFDPARIEDPNATTPASSQQLTEADVADLQTLKVPLGEPDGDDPAAQAPIEPAPTAEVTTEAQPTILPATATLVPPTTTSPPATATIPPTPTSQPTSTPAQPPAPVTGSRGAAGGQSAGANGAASARTWPISHLNGGFVWERQTWNNCGPTNITMALSFYGWTQDQSFAGERLKPDREDKNVSPHELAGFTEQYTDLSAVWRYGGDLDMLRRLVAAGFPVVIERSHMFEGYEWLGHYQTIVGYDDLSRVFYIYDSFLGDDENNQIRETYDDVDAGWREFNRVFVVPYLPSREAELMAILGPERATLTDSASHAFSIAQADAALRPDDGFAYFNMGTSLVELGLYEEASRAFDRSLTLGLPWRMLWYQFGPFEAYYRVERYDDVLLFVDNNLSNGGDDVEETYYWQGRVRQAQGDVSGAAASFRQALRRNPNFTEAQNALDALGA